MRHEKSSPIEISLTVYRWLLTAYPPAFRERYGDEMARVFRDVARDAWHRGGYIGLISLWGRILADTLANAGRARTEAFATAGWFTFLVGLEIVGAEPVLVFLLFFFYVNVVFVLHRSRV